MRAAPPSRSKSQLHETLSLLKDAETGHRGYLLLGDESYLEPYQAAVGTIDRPLEAVGTALADDPQQLRTLATFRLIANDKIEELGTTIERYQSGHIDEAVAVVHGGAGKGLMDRARETVTRMVEAEQARVAALDARVAQSGARLKAGIVATALPFATFAAFAMFNAYWQVIGLVLPAKCARSWTRQGLVNRALTIGARQADP